MSYQHTLSTLTMKTLNHQPPYRATPLTLALVPPQVAPSVCPCIIYPLTLALVLRQPPLVCHYIIYTH